MVKVVYEVVEHDGGWAYKFDKVFSETFPTHEAAHAAAAAPPPSSGCRAGPRRSSLRTARASGTRETASGSDRPVTEVVDKKTS